MSDSEAQVPATLNAQNAMIGVHGKDIVSSLRKLARQGLKEPRHSIHHAWRLTRQLGRVMLGDTPHALDPKDARFSDPTWRLNPFYRRALQAYLSWQQALGDWVEGSQLSTEDRARAHFLLNLLGDALSPSNTLLNPLAVKEIFNTGGVNLLSGLQQLLDDVLHNGGMPRQVSRHAFEVGRNLATSKGHVVYRNEQLELLHYRPLTEQVHAKPLLIIPPQINKFYIFDLDAQKSFVQYALKNGLQVFMISWRNPDARHREWGLSTYVQVAEECVDVCRTITGSSDVHLMGACAGGMTMAALQGHLRAKRQLRKIASASYLVSLLDAQLNNPITLFIDEQTLEAAKRRSYQSGVLDGEDMARVFAWMRPNDLVWNYWVNNYLLGKQPPAFDVLYWNNDSTRLPAALHSELLDLYQHNPLSQPGALEVCGTPIDLHKVNVDSFTIAGINDHITPWQSVYRSARLLGGDARFVLANNGHIQSILNPPGNPKASFFEGGDLHQGPERWKESSTRHPGSWWPLWLEWIKARSGELHAAPEAVGNAQYPAMEAAPGTYVHVR